MKYGGIAFVAIVAIALIMVFLFAVVGDGPSGPSTKNKDTLIKGDPNSDADSNYVLPVDRIPTTQAARQTSSPLGLLPSRWKSDKDANDGSRDAVAVPLQDRKAIAKAAYGFVKQWETFTPARPGATGKYATGEYRDRIMPYVFPGYITDIVKRNDNIQSARICPDEGCSVGSKWEKGQYTKGTSQVRFFDSNEAFITIHGVVDYSDPVGHTLDGTRWLRTYGLLLRRYGNKWLVYRSAASTSTQF